MSALAARLRQRPLPPVLTEGALLGVLTILTLISARLAEVEAGFAVLAAVGVAPLLVLCWRREAPLATFVLVALLAVPSRVLVGANGPAEVAVLMAIYTVASRRSLGWTLGVLVLDATILAVALSTGSAVGSVGVELLGQLVAGTVVALLGLYVQSRRAAEAALRERAERLDRERDLNARAAVEEERRRISRELHDVVAHHVSVMTLKAGAMEKQLQHAPVDPELGEAAAGIRRTGQQAMTELRRLLGLLERDDTDDGRSPQPDLEALDLLAARMRDAQMPLDLTVVGEPDGVSAGMALAVYRIVQEALTNTLRHAGPVPTTVAVTVGDAAVSVRVRDRGTPPVPPVYPDGSEQTGRGLLGMRERASLFAGTVEAGPHPDGGFEVHAVLPRSPLHR